MFALLWSILAESFSISLELDPRFHFSHSIHERFLHGD
jgi:hypothetical protein